ncbi:MAG: hypothetical protein EXQ55_08195 [Acidobacteria bacterium]|nr:hypothetical protein [Acidobacteriota bacterium]
MKLRHWALAGAAAVWLTTPLVAAINTEVTDADVRRAFGIAAGPTPAGARFHAPYILPVRDAMVERIEVITEFRRFVLASEAQTVLGNWTLARGGYDAKGRTLKELLSRWRGQVSIKLRARFHPRHLYSFMPAIDILIGEPAFLAIDVMRSPLMSDGSPTSMRSQSSSRRSTRRRFPIAACLFELSWMEKK